MSSTLSIRPVSLLKITTGTEEEIPPLLDKIISVVIPTKNAGIHFLHSLKRIKSQKGLKEIEIIVVDSGSTDTTLEIAGNEGAKIIQIPAKDFTHAYSRNKGAESARGDYLLFMVQDALPLTDRWVWELATTLEQNNVAAVSCAEYPRSDCDLFYQWIIWNHYRTLNLDRDRILAWNESCESYLGLRSNSQINSVAGLIRKDIFTKYRFQKQYAEDLDLGIRLIRDGYRLGFLYSTRVLHSHNRPAYYFLKRSYVDTRFLTDVFADFQLPEIRNPERLFRDIADLYSKTGHAASRLAAMKPGDTFKLDDLADRIPSLYSENSDGMESMEPDFIDNDLDDFMQKLAPYTEERSSHSSDDNNILVPPYLDTVRSLLAYVSLSHTVADAFIMKDLASALYKMTALSCGAHIAYLYLTTAGRHGDEPFITELDKELNAGI